MTGQHEKMPTKKMPGIRTLVAFGVVMSALTLGGCGRREALMPLPGEQMPPKAAHAATAPTTDALMEPTDEARPERSEELLKKSEERKPDPFDLPPPGR